jgi:hypothetical protein
MDNIGWIMVSVGSPALIGIIVTWLMLRGKRSGFPVQEERAFNHELMTLGSSLVVLGIVFGTDRLISYSFVGAGVLLSMIGAIKSRKDEQRSSLEMR